MKTQREIDRLAVRAELRLARFHKRFMEQYMKERLEMPQLQEVENADLHGASGGLSSQDSVEGLL